MTQCEVQVPHWAFTWQYHTITAQCAHCKMAFLQRAQTIEFNLRSKYYSIFVQKKYCSVLYLYCDMALRFQFQHRLMQLASKLALGRVLLDRRRRRGDDDERRETSVLVDRRRRRRRRRRPAAWAVLSVSDCSQFTSDPQSTHASAPRTEKTASTSHLGSFVLAKATGEPIWSSNPVSIYPSIHPWEIHHNHHRAKGKSKYQAKTTEQMLRRN